MIDLIDRLRIHRSRGAASRENKEPREARVDTMKSDVARYIVVIALNADEQQEKTTGKLQTFVSRSTRPKWTRPTLDLFTGKGSAVSTKNNDWNLIKT